MLRALAKNWMPLLLNAFLATPPVQRTQLEEAISAYACCCEPATLAQFFRAVVTKLIKARKGWIVLPLSGRQVPECLDHSFRPGVAVVAIDCALVWEALFDAHCCCRATTITPCR